MTANNKRTSFARLTRRGAILAPLAMSACSVWDDWFGEKKTPLPGKRENVFQDRRGLALGANPPKVVLPPPVHNAGWPQAGGNPTHYMGHLAANEALKPVWKAKIGEGAGDRQILMAQPVVLNGRVYTMDSAAVVSAFSLTDGQRIWKADTRPPNADDSTNVGGGLGADGDTLYAVNGLSQVVALDAATGKEKWRQDTFTPVRSAPTIADGRLFLLTIDERMIAFNTADGHPLWSHPGARTEINMLGKAAPAYTQGLVIAGYGSGELTCIHADSGTTVWSDALGASQNRASTADLLSIRGLPVIANGLVYAIGMGGILACDDVPTGRRVWERQIAGEDTPYIAGGWMFIVTAQQEVAALDITDGKIAWITQLPHWEDPDKRKHSLTWYGPMLVADRLIVAGTAQQALSLSPYTGEILGRMDLTDKAAPSVPIVANGTLMFLTNDGNLSALR